MMTRICRIADHPITHYPDNVKEKYVRGLGCVLHIVSQGHPNMRMKFEQWGYSILGREINHCFESSDTVCIKNAISLNRIGFHFFRLKHQFYFDCFYLTESYDKSLLKGLHEFLQKQGCSFFTKTALERTNCFFTENQGTLQIENSLINHRRLNEEFSRRYENRILIVATVSAGKSTLINALTGHTFNRVMTGVCTSRICKIHNKVITDGITLRKTDVLEYDSDINSHSSDESYEAAIHFESSLGNHRICLIDTPGVNNSRDISHHHITSDAIKSKNYDFVIFISNGQYNGTNDERQLLNLISKNVNKPILFVLNQLDKFKISVDDINKMIMEYGQELKSIGFNSPQIFPLSAQYAYLIRNESVLDDDERDELKSMRKRFAKHYLDLQQYQSVSSNTELEKSGIISLENAILKLSKS